MLEVYPIGTKVQVFGMEGKVTAITIREFNRVTYEVEVFDKKKFSTIKIDNLTIEATPTEKIGFINAQ